MLKQRFKIKTNNHGFTLVELLVVLVIIGILTTFAVVAIGSSRMRGRDAKRVADIKQLQTALDMYYSNNSMYPTLITSGQPLSDSAGTVYMGVVPTNPTPYSDNNCPNNNYTYAPVTDGSNYTINFCLGGTTNNINSGINSASNNGLNTAPGLIGWWKLDGNALDSSGSGFNGTLVGGTLTTDKAEKSNSAYSFDGSTGNYISIGSVALPSGASARSVSYWFKTSTQQTNYNAPFWYGTLASNQMWSMYLHYNSIYLDTYGGGGTNCVFATYYNGNWHHFVSTYTGVILTLYIDGAYCNANNSFTSATVLSTTEIGAGCAGHVCGFNGSVDDVRVYNRALSADEVLAIYNATK